MDEIDEGMAYLAITRSKMGGVIEGTRFISTNQKEKITEAR